MRKEKETDFVSLLRDETFLKLVKESLGKENQLDLLEKEFPGQREAIAYAVEFVQATLSDQRKMAPDDVSTVWRNIKKYATQRKKYSLQRFILSDLWKVAAVFTVVLASSVFVYQQLNHNDQLVEMAALKTVANDEAMIILSDGSRHILNKKDSLIEYSADGGQVVVKSDRQEEKLENPTSSDAAKINQIVVPFGHRHTITLSDGTRVQLNSGSRLVFPAGFSGKTREVYLKGEGYFEVFKNPNQPFIVKTDVMDIKVLGTVFDISAYEDEQNIYTVLVEGKVAVSQKNLLFGTTDKNLSPGQGYFYSSATKTSDIRMVDLYDYISWKDGLFLFKDKPLNSIVSRLEKYYNQKIGIENGKLPNTLISGKLVLSDNLDEVMQYLAKTLEARYEKNKEGVYTITN
jgi:ferric-dicitrate binding protein FerR (iron transport regulator)